jgi:hypothetical protein
LHGVHVSSRVKMEVVAMVNGLVGPRVITGLLAAD